MPFTIHGVGGGWFIPSLSAKASVLVSTAQAGSWRPSIGLRTGPTGETAAVYE
jgi:hypothetical protein